jgi:ABC-type hemin transport system substrate-binding protein
MSRSKRTSRILEKTELRAAGLKYIVPNIKFDEDYSLKKLTEAVEQLRNKINVYNTALSMIDSSKTEIEEMEKNLSSLTEKMLMVVAIKYGKDSREYELAGGVRTSDACGGLRLRIREIKSSRLKSVAEQALDENGKTS